MFTLYSNHRGIRRGILVGLVVLSLIIALLPSVVLAAPPRPPMGPMPPMHNMGGGYCANHYLVHRGDTLSGIAVRFGVSMWALQQANGIRNPNRIYAGQWLCIPRGSWGGPGHPGPHGPHP